MSDDTKAVFLSYASQDVEAAKKIAEALRAAGVEVWFDQSELRGGDAWDQKLRRQIKECALFVPVITPNTNARAEGYFRLEWKLAVDRSHLMADDAPFLFPIVVGDVADATARVPDRFREVQWTRLRLDETPAELGARVAKLLSGDPAHSRQLTNDNRAGHTRHTRWQWWMIFPVIGTIMGLMFAARPLWKSFRRAEPKPAAVAPAIPAAPLGEAAQLTARAYAITQKVGFTREDLAAAEVFMQKAVELEPGSARAQSVRAWVQACYLMRNWDISERRLQEVQAGASRALALEPSDADALNALCTVFEKQRVPAEAEKIARRAVAAAPDNYRSRLLLGRALRALGKKPESMEVLQEAVRRFPDNLLCRYELAANYASIGMLGEVLTLASVSASIEQLDPAIAAQPFASAILMKAVLEASGRGDLGRMRVELDRLEGLPLSDRTEDRAVFIAMWGGLLERQPERVLASAKLTARPYFEDVLVAGPKAWGTALAYRLAGKDALARQEWLTAEATLRQRVREQPNELDTMRLATTLAWQGDNEGAERLMAPIEAAWREDMNRARARDLSRYYAARGDAAKTVPYLRQVINFNTFLTDHVLPVDPWWDKLRGSPEFEALLKEAPTRGLVAPPPAAIAPKADDKSVAVLAFANLSDDKANEYFSDGISEELLNVLAKVPGLKVSARTSAFYFKGKQVPMAEIAQQLGVAYVVEGSVRKQGDKVRITAQLIKAADGFHVWSDTFTRDLKDIFAVQDEIAGLIAKNLSLKLGASSPLATIDPDSYGLFLAGRQALDLRNFEGYDRAEALFTQVIERAPAFARAYAARAETGYLRANNRREIGLWPQRDSALLDTLAKDLETALRLEPDLPEAVAVRGLINGSRWRGDESMRDFRRAIELNPNYALAHLWLGIRWWAEGRVPEARTELLRAAELDPMSATIAAACSAFLHDAGYAAESLAQARRAVALQPNGTRPNMTLAHALALSGRSDEAVALTRKLMSGDSPWQPGRYLRILVQAGLKDEAERIYREKSPGYELQNKTSALAALGRWPEFFEIWQVECVNPQAPFPLYDPIYDPIRKDPRFLAVLQQIGMAEAHERAQAWLAAHPPEKTK